MGAVVFPIREFYDQSSELIGIKSGLLLPDHSIKRILKEKFQEPFLDHPDQAQIVRIRAEDIEDMIRYIRIRIGNIPSKRGNHYNVLRKYVRTEKDIMIYSKWMGYGLRQSGQGVTVNRQGLKKKIMASSKLPEELAEAIASMVVEKIDDSIVYSPSKTHEGITSLDKLFDSEVFPKRENTFIDQKFIDYLAVNGSEIEQIHWRNFERFVAEYFKRQGLTVNLGPGGNDGGIDIRVINEKDSKDPLVLIQCKRYKEERKVSIETVKAFHSDVTFERAKHGLIATTSYIAPGGKKIVTSRDYNISFAEKERIRFWATSMWSHA